MLKNKDFLPFSAKENRNKYQFTPMALGKNNGPKENWLWIPHSFEKFQNANFFFKISKISFMG